MVIVIKTEKRETRTFKKDEVSVATDRVIKSSMHHFNYLEKKIYTTKYIHLGDYTSHARL